MELMTGILCITTLGALALVYLVVRKLPPHNSALITTMTDILEVMTRNYLAVYERGIAQGCQQKGSLEPISPERLDSKRGTEETDEPPAEEIVTVGEN